MAVGAWASECWMSIVKRAVRDMVAYWAGGGQLGEGEERMRRACGERGESEGWALGWSLVREDSVEWRLVQGQDGCLIKI